MKFARSTLILAAVATPAAAQISLDDVREVRLENGIRLLVLEDHSTPTFTIMLWVPCGGRTEEPGLTGISHLLEHLYSMGSSRMGPRELDEYVARHGGQKNASTSHDFTNYYESMPMETFERILEIEADRLATLALPQDKIDSEREVVREERRMRYETSKGGFLWLELLAAAYTTHPYRQPVIGTMEDLTRATRDQIVAYHRRHYTTENALYVLVGDFDADEAIAAFRRHFGPIPRSPRPQIEIPQEPPQTEPHRRTFYRREITLPSFAIGWKTVGIDDPDFFPLKALQYYLANGRTGAFERELERGREIATGVSAYQMETMDPGLFVVQGEARPGVPIERLEAAVYEVIEAVRQGQVDETTLQTAKAIAEVSFINELQTTMEKAQALGFYATVSRQRGFRFLGDYITRLRSVTAQQVAAVAQRYLQPETRTVVVQYPQAALSWEPFGEAWRTRLPNGLTVLVHERPGVPAAAISVQVRAGSRYAPPDLSGAARLTADLLQAGTEDRNEEQLLSALALLGTTLDAQVLHDTTTWSAFVRAEDAGAVLAIIAEILQKPAFTGTGYSAARLFERVRERLVARRRAARDNPQELLVEHFYRALYGAEHPYGRPIDGLVEDLEGATRERVAAFYRSAYRPDRTSIIVVGSVPRDVVGAAALRHFGGWAAGGEDGGDSGRAEPRPARERIVIVHVPGMTQARIRIGHPGIPRTHEEYDILMLANQVLGGAGMTSRLMQDVRTQRGLAYSIWSLVFPRELGGAFAIQVETKNESVGEAIRAALDHVQRLRDERVPEEELALRQSQFAGQLPFRMEKLEDRARLWGDALLFGLGPDYLQKQIEAIRSATPDQVRAAAARHLDPARARIVIVGDANQFRGQLEGLGDVRVIERGP